MVKLKESNIGPILPDRYYIWTWRPDTTNKIITEKKLYRKHLTGIPYFTRHHVKVTLVYLYGVDVLQYIHIISGRKLLQQGIRELSDMNGKLLKRGATKFWFKGKFVKAKKFIIPDEYKIDKHRRRRFMVQMHRVFKSKGKRHSMKDTQSNSMDNGKAYLPPIRSRRDYKSILLSYRIYERLSQEEKVKFNLLFLQYPPLVSSLALYLRKKMNIPIQKVLFIKAQRDMIEIFDEASIRFMGYLPKERHIKKSLLFQCFVPLENIKIRKAYAYIMTNRMIENQYWVYPVRLADNYKIMQKGKYKFYTEVFGKVGIPGITKIQYSNE